MQNIISLAKRRGFVFPSSEIYGGVEALFDYGPLGALMKQNIKKEWFKRFVQQREEVVSIDASILMSPKVWEASGHVQNFTDPLIECKQCHMRHRADHLVLMSGGGNIRDTKKMGEFQQMLFTDPEEAIKKYPQEAKDSYWKCENCGGTIEITTPKKFNLMFKTFLGPVEDEKNATYLRPETAQAMFVDFKLVQETQRLQLPFGIAQQGKAFRNEITTGNYLFRLRELEQMEIEYFVKPGEDEKWFDYWVKEWWQFFVGLGLKEKNMRLYEHPKESLSHYSKRTVDIEYKFPFGWGELAGIANRTDFDLRQHAEFSKKDLSYTDPDTKEKYYPFVVEPTMGVDRLFFALLVEGHEEVKGARTTTTKAAKEVETVLHLNPLIAPVQVAVLPLVKNKPEIVAKAREVFQLLVQQFSCQYDETGAIGRRYRRQDEVGTPYAITVDFDTLADNTVTLRDRDSMAQERIAIDKLVETIEKRLNA